MNSEKRGSRIFHRYHQQQRQNEDRTRKVDGNGVLVTPTRRRAYPASTKSTSSRTITTTSNVVDDLTLGYNPSPGQRSAMERNPKDYEASPASSKSFRIVSLDGCYEEQVSPLLTDSSSSISSYKIRNVPMIPAPPRCVTTKREINVNRRRKKTAHNSMPTVSTNDIGSRQEKDVTKVTPPSDSTTRRRRSAHARSQFVFDGNLCFGAVSPPPPMYLPTSPMLAYPSPAYPSTPRASFPGATGMNYPPMATPISMSPRTTPMMPLPVTPMAHMSPPPTAAFSSGSIHREQHQELKQGRKTPPPTPKEQRRRNRAMPSLQYEDLVFNQLRQEQLEEYEREQLPRQNTW